MQRYASLDSSQSPAVVLALYDYDGTCYTVVNGDGTPFPGPHTVPPDWVDVTDVTPQPNPGWTYDGTTFTQPTSQANRSDLTARAQAALHSNIGFLGVQNPTPAQVATQVQSLTRQMNGLIRLQYDALGSVFGA